MTRRATFTAAELARAIRVAAAQGKVAVQTPIGIAFVDPATVGKVAAVEAEGNTCDGRFGKAP